jgi:multicomponent Na+:H+ antiporter subunit D
MQIAANALAQLTVTLSLGAAALATSRTQVSDIEGLGRVMPWVFAAFTCGAISLIGAPPLAGAWSKLWLFATAGEAGAYWAMAVIGAASLLTLAAMAPLTARVLTEPAPANPFTRTDGTPILSLAAVVLAGAATACLVLFVDPLTRFLAPVWEMAP